MFDSSKSTNHRQLGREFGPLLKQWRGYRCVSQMELALRSDVSQRHISFLELGRSTPSRDMVLRLAESLEIPLREQNLLLSSAGFAANFNERTLDGDDMRPVRKALEMQLQHHNPFPAFVVNRRWDILMQNDAAPNVFGAATDLEALWQQICGNNPKNLMHLTFHPDGLRNFLVNWEEIAAKLLSRTRRELLSCGDPNLKTLLDEILSYPDIPTSWKEPSLDAMPPPVYSMSFQAGPFSLNMFSMISTFGTPQDITTDELRVESFFPSDETSEQLMRQLANRQSNSNS